MMSVGLTRILDLLLLVGEVAWIYAWAVATGAWSGNGTVVALPALSLLLLAALAMTRAGTSGRWHAIAVRGLVVGLGVAAVALVALTELNPAGTWTLDPSAWGRWFSGPNLGRAVLAGGLAGVAWQRGVVLGRSRPGTAVVEGSFRIGTIAIGSLLALVGVAGRAAHLSSDALIPSTLVLLITGLVGMPLARIADTGSQPRHRHGSALAPSGPWLTMLLSLVAGILAVTLLLARLFTFERIGIIVDSLVGRLDDALSAVVYLLAIPFGLLVQALVFLMRLVLKPRPDQPQPQQPDLNWMSKLGQQSPDAISPTVLFALKVLVALALAAVLAWLFWRTVSRLQRFWGQDDVDEVRDSVWSWPGWMAVWRWILKLPRPAKVRLMGAISLRRTAVEEETTVRSLYRGLLRLGADIGHPRHIAETPLEYEERLNRVVPESAGEVRVVSDAYVHLRYGPPPPATPNLDPIISALDRLRGLWEKRISGGNRRRA